MSKRHFFMVAATIIGSQYAQAQKDSASQQLDEVVVTANKTPQKQSTTGKVITVIDKEQLDKSRAKTVGQLLNEQAGITINGALNNAGTNQSIYMRGAASGRTLILLDGIPVSDPSLIDNEFDINLFSIDNVERIEICKGAQSTLYGSDAIAGVINIITVKQDVKKPFNISSSIAGGSYGTFKGNVQLYGKAGKLTYTARYAKLLTSGFSAAYDSTGKKGFDKDGYNGDVVNAQALFQASQELSFKSFILVSRYKTDVDAGAFQDDRDYTLKNKYLTTGAGFQFHRNDLSITGNYQYSDITRNDVNDSTDAPGFTKYLKDVYFGKTQFAEVYANAKLGSGFSWLQGADYRFNSMNEQYLSISSYGPYTTQFPDTTVSQASLYSSLLYNSSNERLNVELGGRLNMHSSYGSNYTYTFNPSYTIDNHYRVFGSIASGFKAPSLYQLYSSYGTSGLKPEKSINEEIGIQQKYVGLTNRLVYFHRDIKEGIDFDYVNYVYYNIAKQTVDGLELESSWQPAKGLTITANYTWLHSTEHSESRLDFKDTSYNYSLRRPKHNLNVTAGYQFGNGLYINASAKYVSSRYDVGDYQAADILMSGYFLLNAYAEFRFCKTLKLFANAQNLANKKFFDIRGYNSIPFTFIGGLQFQL
ncbi:MAG TPA: TonB-dependent receptor [Chitinophagaceae bacterium]|jgi:vitamin B12 transporter